MPMQKFHIDGTDFYPCTLLNMCAYKQVYLHVSSGPGFNLPNPVLVGDGKNDTII